MTDQSQAELARRIEQLERELRILREEGRDLPFQNVIQSLSQLEQRMVTLEDIAKGQGMALNDDPTRKELRQTNDYAVQLFYMNELEQAGQLLDDLCGRFDDEAVVWNNLGVVNVAMGKSEQARAAFQKALELDATAVSVVNNQGVLALMDEQPESALEMFEEAQRREQHNVEVLLNLAHAYEAMEQHERAVSIWQTVLTIDESQVEARNLLRQYYQQ